MSNFLFLSCLISLAVTIQGGQSVSSLQLVKTPFLSVVISSLR